METADPFTTSLVAGSVALLMVHAGIGKGMLAWRVAAERRRRRRRLSDKRRK